MKIAFLSPDGDQVFCTRFIFTHTFIELHAKTVYHLDCGIIFGLFLLTSI